MDFLWKLNPKGLTHFFWRNPLFFPHKILISSGPINRNPKTLYRIKCDVGASKNAGQAFSTSRLSSHFILYQISAFRFFSPLNIINHRFLLFKHHIMAESRSMKNNRHLVKLPCHMLRFMGIASNRDKFAAKFAVSS